MRISICIHSTYYCYGLIGYVRHRGKANGTKVALRGHLALDISGITSIIADLPIKYHS
jgi:hypothetical protein